MNNKDMPAYPVHNLTEETTLAELGVPEKYR